MLFSVLYVAPPGQSPTETSGSRMMKLFSMFAVELQLLKHLPADHLSLVYLSLLRTVLVLESDWVGVRKFPNAHP